MHDKCATGSQYAMLVRSNDAWSAYQWADGVTTQIEPIVPEARL